ncbi:GntR family transcriptional regulator [candidate division KSB1 bacterium]|nr:GntR family transcriptional regulator [candidate division KSB1 bacterium]
MILHLTDLSDEPLQSQIVRQVRANILAGDLAPGYNLPSIRALAREQKVSVITVQRAYETLLRQELIHSRRGKGFFVSTISNEQKRDIARQHLFASLQKPLLAALSEGLSEENVLAVVREIIKSETRKAEA